MQTKAYYTTPSGDVEEPNRHEVIVTTEHPLSSYGQPVVVDGSKITPAVNWTRTLHLYWSEATAEAQDLLAKVTGGATVAEQREAFGHLFGI